MNSPICRIPSPLDRQFAREHSTDVHVIANLRGLYEFRTKDTINSIEEYLTKLLPFRKKMGEEDKKALNKLLNVNPNKARATIIRRLKSEFTNAEIQELTDLLYSNFTEVVDLHLENPSGQLKAFIEERKKSGKHYSRRDIIRNIGVDNILLGINNLTKDQYYNPAKTFTYGNDLLKKLIDGGHIDTFLWLAREEIYKREGIKFGRKIKYIVEFNGDDSLEAGLKIEESVKEGWMREMEKESPFKTLGQEVRSYLGRQILYFPTKQPTTRVVTVNIGGKKVTGKVTVDVDTPHRSKNGFIKMHNPTTLHKALQEIFVGCRDKNHMLTLLERAARNDINLQRIYKDLIADSKLADAFYRDFKKTKCNYTKAFRNRLNNIMFAVMKSTGKNLSYYHYSHSFTSEDVMTPTIFKDLDGEAAIHGDKFNTFRAYINENIGGNDYASTIIQSSSISAFPDEDPNAFARQSYMATKSVVKTISDRLGLFLSNNQIEDLIKNKVYLKSFLADAKSIANDSRIKANMPLSDITSLYRDRVSSMLESVNSSSSTTSKSIRIGDATYFTDIVTSKLANSIDEIKSYANDAKYALSLDSEAEQNAILEEVVSNIRNSIMQKFGRSSEYYTVDAEGKLNGFRNAWIDALYNITVESLKDPDNFIYHFTYDRAMIFDDILAEDFSSDLDLTSFLANFFSYGNEVDSGYARYPIFTTGDSLALKFVTAKKYSYNKLINEFIGVARQEIARMQLEAQVKKHLEEEKYETGGIVSLANKTDEEVSGDFVYLKFLNREDVKNEEGKTYKEQIRDALKKSSPTDNTPFVKVLTEILKRELFEEYKNEFLDKVKNKDIFAVSETGNSFKNFPNFYNLNPMTMDRNSPANGLMLYYLNTKLAYIYQFQFLGANPATYGLSTAMQKRYKAYNAPGNPMNIWAKDFNGNYYIKTETFIDEETGEEKTVPVQQKVKYFEDTHTSAEETDPDFARAMAFNFGRQSLNLSVEDAKKPENYDKVMEEGRKDYRYELYKHNDSTDGQGFRVLESYRRVMGMAYQWTEDMENAYNRVQEIRHNSWDRASKTLFNKSFDDATAEEKYKAKLVAALTADEIDALNSLDVVFQPIKPHTSTVELVSNGNNDMLLVPVEHKYAEALIIPELFPENSFRRMLGVEMEEQGIDLSCSKQCVKVGSFGTAKLTETNKKGKEFKTTPDTFADEFSKGYTHTIDYSDYTIQTNVPEHINASQLFGTQLRKHVFDAIQLMQAYNYGGVEAVKVYGETLNFGTENGGKAFLKFYNALICENINSTLLELTNKLATNDKISDLLSELKSNDFNSSLEDAMRFSLDDNGDFVNPICEPSGMYDIESILTSIFKMEVNKQHINGGSCVQVSDYGISNFGTELKVHVDSNNNIIYVDCAMAWDLSWTDANGNKVPLKFSDYCNADGTLIMETRTVNGKEVTKEKIEWDYEGILDLVAYRIPTEREYSTINLRVKRFFPKITGGTIMVPSQFVTVAGFDFDIDKLYYFRKEFKQRKELSDDEVNKVWFNIYGLKTNKETGLVDKSSANRIYWKLKDAYDKAHREYRELTGAKDYSDKSIGSPELAADIKKKAGISEESSKADFPDEFKPKSKLYQYWEEAGLSKSKEEGGEGMSYTEYFNNYLSKNKDKYIEFESYDYSKDVTENSVVARNNELIKCIQSRLMSPDTFNARYTPGGFINSKRDKRVVKAAKRGLNIPLEESKASTTINDYENYIDDAIKNDDTKVLNSLDEALDVTNVLTTAEYNAKNRVASKVIGIMANHNTNAVYSKAMGHLELKQPIEIFGYTLRDLNNSNTGRDYMLTLAELLAASVDAVKDPVLGDLMINSYTANVAALLARLGLSTEEIGLFLNQPIIEEICETAINNGDSSITSAINKVALKYEISTKGNYSASAINKKDLFESLNAPIQKQDPVQGNILRAFASIAQQAQALSDFIAKTKYTAANSIDNTIGGLLALIYDNKAANEQETSINKHLSMGFEGFSSQKAIEDSEKMKSPIILRKDLTLESMQTDDYRQFLITTPFAFEQMVHDAVRAYIKKLGKFFPYTTELYENTYDAIYSNVIFGQMNQEIMDNINRQLPVYILSTRARSQFNPDFRGEDNITNKQYYTVDFPEMLRDFLEKREALKEANNKEAEFKVLQDKYSFLKEVSLEGILDNDLLDKLVVEEYAVLSDMQSLNPDTGVRYNISIEEDSQFDKDIKNSLITSWDSLVKDKEHKVENARESLAHALFMYNFHTRGYEVGRNAFSNITPLSVVDTLMIDPYTSYSEFFNKLVRGEIYSVDVDKFFPLFYANNINNNKLVKAIYGLTTTSDGTRLNDKRLPSGVVTKELGKPAVITFDGGKQNYDNLTLPNSKRSGDMRGKRILVPAFKIVDKYSKKVRLFVLKPRAETGSFNFSDPNYNIRPEVSPVSYVEISVKGISNATVDYSNSGLNFINTSFEDESESVNGNSLPIPYAELNKDNSIEENEGIIRENAEELTEKSKENQKKKGDCIAVIKL